jgi:hypothetical protein
LRRHEPQRKAEPPTSNRIRADISGERTREKVAFPDPTAAPLGTDDEAAGHPPTMQQRRLEDEERPTPEPLPEPSQGPVIFYFAFAALLAVAIIIVAYTLA